MGQSLPPPLYTPTDSIEQQDSGCANDQTTLPLYTLEPIQRDEDREQNAGAPQDSQEMDQTERAQDLEHGIQENRPDAHGVETSKPKKHMTWWLLWAPFCLFITVILLGTAALCVSNYFPDKGVRLYCSKSSYSRIALQAIPGPVMMTFLGSIICGLVLNRAEKCPASLFGTMILFNLFCGYFVQLGVGGINDFTCRNF